MKAVRIIALAFIGLFIGLGLAILSQGGFLQRWEKLNEPSQDIRKNFSAPNIQDIDLGTKYTKPCDYSSVEFFQFSFPPKNIVDCVQVKLQYVETARLETYVGDSSGNIWEWSYYADPSSKWLSLIFGSALGLIIGIVVGIIANLLARARTTDS